MSEARKTPQSHFTGPVVIDPLTRIEGHLRIEVEVKDGRVSEARSVGTLYRGLETILVGRDPRDVQHFTQRTCGVCTYTHALASTRALEDAIKVEIPKNATYIRNLVLGMQYLHDHIVHFYHLHALDFVDVTSALQADPVKAAKICSSVSPRPASADGFKAVQAKLKAFVESGQLGPFTNAYFLGGHPAYYLDPEANLIATAHYLEALRLQVKAARAMAVFGAKNPHTQFLVAGGVTCYESLTPERICRIRRLVQGSQRLRESGLHPGSAACRRRVQGLDQDRRHGQLYDLRRVPRRRAQSRIPVVQARRGVRPQARSPAFRSLEDRGARAAQLVRGRCGS